MRGTRWQIPTAIAQYAGKEINWKGTIAETC